jgi:hypothetical protein
MAKVPRPRVATKEALDLDAFPEDVHIELAEVAGAAREVVLALSVACDFTSSARSLPPT